VYIHHLNYCRFVYVVYTLFIKLFDHHYHHEVIIVSVMSFKLVI